MAQENNKRKQNRVRNMILSVVIAIVAWAVVTYTTDPDITKTFTGIHVEIIGEDGLVENGYAIINRDDIPNLSVKMRGKRSDLMKALDKTKVIVDVSQIAESGQVEVEGTVKLPNSRITVEKISSQTVPVDIVKLETKEVPVRIIQTGELSGKLVKSSLEKETISVRGSRKDLGFIKEAQVSVNISKLEQTAEETYGYSLILSEGVEKETLTTLITDDTGIKVTNTIYNSKELSVQTKVSSEEEYILDIEKTKVEPDTIKVGVQDGVEIESLTVTIEEKAEDGEYSIDKAEGVYIPENRRKVTVKPVWEKIN